MGIHVQGHKKNTQLCKNVQDLKINLLDSITFSIRHLCYNDNDNIINYANKLQNNYKNIILVVRNNSVVKNNVNLKKKNQPLM